MGDLRKKATELNGKTINLFKYGWGYARTLPLFMYDMASLNGDIDWKNIKPKPFKVNIKDNMFTDASGNKATWQEVDVKDQILTVTAVDAWANTITCSCVWPLTYKRWQRFWNTQKTEEYILTADVAQSTPGAGTIVLTVADEKNAVATDNIRMIGYSKPYRNNEGNTFDADQVTELYNIFTNTNMSLNLDINEVNANYIYQNWTKEYLKQKSTEASRKMLLGIWRDVYFGGRGTEIVGWTTAYTAGWLDWFIRNESGIAGLNLGTGTGAGVGEININGATTLVKKTAFLDAVTAVYMSSLPNIKGPNKLMFMCTTSFMREIEELFYDKLVINDTLAKIDLEVRQISFSWGTISFMVDEMMDDMNKTVAAGVASIKKTGYFVPIDYCSLVLRANNVATKDGQSVTAMGMWVYFIPPQTAEESFDLRMFTSYSFIWWGIKSWAYRKVNLQW